MIRNPHQRSPFLKEVNFILGWFPVLHSDEITKPSSNSLLISIFIYSVLE